MTNEEMAQILEAEAGICDQMAGVVEKRNIAPIRWKNEAIAMRAGAAALRAGEWKPIADFPEGLKTASVIVELWCVHPNAAMAKRRDEWEGPVIGRWTTHNGGGFSWDGHYGEITHYRELPAPPEGV